MMLPVVFFLFVDKDPLRCPFLNMLWEIKSKNILNRFGVALKGSHSRNLVAELFVKKSVNVHGVPTTLYTTAINNKTTTTNVIHQHNIF